MAISSASNLVGLIIQAAPAALQADSFNAGNLSSVVLNVIKVRNLHTPDNLLKLKWSQALLVKASWLRGLVERGSIPWLIASAALLPAPPFTLTHTKLNVHTSMHGLVDRALLSASVLNYELFIAFADFISGGHRQARCLRLPYLIFLLLSCTHTLTQTLTQSQYLRLHSGMTSPLRAPCQVSDPPSSTTLAECRHFILYGISHNYTHKHTQTHVEARGQIVKVNPSPRSESHSSPNRRPAELPDIQSSQLLFF